MLDIEKVTGKNAKRLDQIGGGKPGPGRKPDIPNKANGLLKDTIMQAAEEAGGKGGIVAYLTQQARKHPAAFLTPDRSRAAAAGCTVAARARAPGP